MQQKYKNPLEQHIYLGYQLTNKGWFKDMTAYEYICNRAFKPESTNPFIKRSNEKVLKTFFKKLYA